MAVKLWIFGMMSALYCKQATEGVDTVDIIWARITRSLMAAYMGEHPPPLDGDGADHILQGVALAGACFLVIWMFKADLDYLAKRLFLPHYSAHKMCPFDPFDGDPAGDKSL